MYWGDLISLEYGKPVKDKDAINGPVPVYGTNGQIGTSFLEPLCSFPSFIIGRKGAYRGVHYSEFPFSVIDTAFYAVPLSKELNMKWAYYKFLTYDINRMDSGSAIPSTDRYEIYRIEVDLPKLEIQNKVVAILDSFGKKISVNESINQNLEQQAQALIEEYCSQTNTYSQLSSIMKFENGYPFRSKTYLSTGTYHIITIKNVQDGKIDSQGAACINEIPANMHHSCLLQIGDVLLSLTGNVGRVGIVYEQNLLLNQRVAKMIPLDYMILPFLYFIFRQPFMKTQLESIARGTAQLNLSPVETLQLSIPFEYMSARKLSSILSPMFDGIIHNSEESARLGGLRDTLLPRLMSGELDVSDLDIETAKF